MLSPRYTTRYEDLKKKKKKK
ncbi:hypothetical protein K796_03392, partial [Salmonella enterica subsp. enterica serovar Newport str. SHSN006]